MKKISLFAVFTASILLLGSVLMSAPTLNNDFAVGKDATGIQLVSGVLSPITNGGVALGSTSLKFTNLYLSGTVSVATVSATTVSATTLSATNVTASSLTAVVIIVDVTLTSPTAIGQLGINTTGTLYISTGTGAINKWMKVGTQS
jgi:hypothetical protein